MLIHLNMLIHVQLPLSGARAQIKTSFSLGTAVHVSKKVKIKSHSKADNNQFKRC